MYSLMSDFAYSVLCLWDWFMLCILLEYSFSLLDSIAVWIYHNLLSLSSVDEHLDSFQFGHIKNMPVLWVLKDTFFFLKILNSYCKNFEKICVWEKPLCSEFY